MSEESQKVFNTNAELKKALDDILDGLTGTPERRQAKLLSRVQALAKAEDLSFEQTWSLVMGQHPELRENTGLAPEPFAPHLMRQAEIKKLQAEQDKKKAGRDSAQAATSAPVFLVHGMDVGLTCPLPGAPATPPSQDFASRLVRVIARKL